MNKENENYKIRVAEIDDVPEISKAHFEMAMGEARRSVSDADLL